MKLKAKKHAKTCNRPKDETCWFCRCWCHTGEGIRFTQESYLFCKKHKYYSCIICDRKDGGIGPITKEMIDEQT